MFGTELRDSAEPGPGGRRRSGGAAAAGIDGGRRRRRAGPRRPSPGGRPIPAGAAGRGEPGLQPRSSSPTSTSSPPATGPVRSIAIIELGGRVRPRPISTPTSAGSACPPRRSRRSGSTGRRTGPGRTRTVPTVRCCSTSRSRAPSRPAPTSWSTSPPTPTPASSTRSPRPPTPPRPRRPSASAGARARTSGRRRDETRWTPRWPTRRLLGVTVTAAAGDSGSSDDPGVGASASATPHVDFPAASPHASPVAARRSRSPRAERSVPRRSGTTARRVVPPGAG